MRWIKVAASAVLRALLAATVIALILLVLEVLVGLVLVEWEALFG